jgi:phage-related protein
MSTGGARRKPLAFLHGEIKTPPFSGDARIEAGELLRALQEGENLGMPHSRPMPSIGPRCHELRIQDKDKIWRIIYRIDTDAIPIAEVFQKTTGKTPKSVIDACKRRYQQYDEDKKKAAKEAKEQEKKELQLKKAPKKKGS